MSIGGYYEGKTSPNELGPHSPRTTDPPQLVVVPLAEPSEKVAKFVDHTIGLDHS